MTEHGQLPDAGELFDHYASDYEGTVNRSVAITGETVEFFAAQKAMIARHVVAMPNPRILDFGCGTGNSTRALATAFRDSVIVGCDPSADSIAEARGHAGSSGRVTYTQNAGEGLPFADEEFDVAFTACVLHHIERSEHGAWLREVRRVLRPGGSLLVFEHNPYNPLTRKAVRDCPFDEGVVLLEPGYTARQLHDAGFKSSAPRYYLFFPRMLSALRPLEPVLQWVPLGGQYMMAGRRTD